jgi:hypothetical protein
MYDNFICDICTNKTIFFWDMFHVWDSCQCHESKDFLRVASILVIETKFTESCVTRRIKMSTSRPWYWILRQALVRKDFESTVYTCSFEGTKFTERWEWEDELTMGPPLAPVIGDESPIWDSSADLCEHSSWWWMTLLERTLLHL